MHVVTLTLDSSVLWLWSCDSCMPMSISGQSSLGTGLDFALTRSGLVLSRRKRQPSWPPAAAKWRGVRECESRAPGSAPCCSKLCKIRVFPVIAATWLAESRLSLHTALGLAPCSRYLQQSFTRSRSSSNNEKFSGFPRTVWKILHFKRIICDIIAFLNMLRGSSSETSPLTTLKTSGLLSPSKIQTIEHSSIISDTSN